MTRDEMESRFLALRESICAALAKAGAAGFTFKPLADEQDRPHLLRLTRGATGLGLYLSCSHYQNPDKVRVSVDTPNDAKGRAMFWGDVLPYNLEKGGRESSPEINVSLDKSPDQIARDIARRLLPRLNAAWPIYQARMTDVVASMNNRTAVMQALRDMGATWHERADRPISASETIHVHLPIGQGRTLLATVNEYGHIQIPHLSPSVDVLRAMVGAMRAVKES